VKGEGGRWSCCVKSTQDVADDDGGCERTVV
jgi:hypothetical protein